jgi:hypothetical protein
VTDLSQYTDEERELIDKRLCVCGCGGSVAHRNVRTIFPGESHAHAHDALL